MPIEQKGGESVAVCDKCRTEWIVGKSPRPVDFKMKKIGGDVVVLCAPCAPEPLS